MDGLSVLQDVDVQNWIGPWVLLCAILVASLLYVCKRRWNDSCLVFKQKGVPGPHPLPFFGNTLTLLWKGELESYQQWVEEHGPVCGFYNGSLPVLLVTDSDMAQCIYSTNFKCFITRKVSYAIFNSKLAGLPPGLFECEDPAEWKRIRQITSSAFTTLKLKAIFPHMEQSCETLLERIKEETNMERHVNIASMFQLYSLELAVVTVFGQVPEFLKGESTELMRAIETLAAVSHRKFLYLHHPVIELFVESKVPWLISFLRWLSPGKYSHSFKVLRTTIRRLIKLHRDNQTKQSVLDFLVRASDKDLIEDEGPTVHLMEEKIISHCLNFLMAAYDTSSFSLTMCSFLLATHSKVQEKLCSHLDQYWKENPNASSVSAAQDVPYLHMVVNEALRICPVATRIPRKCTQSVEVGRTMICEDEYLMILIPILLFHHNNQVWGDPEVFRPERFSDEEMTTTQKHHFMPFGQGPRNCIGFRLAMIEMKAAIATILRQHRLTTKNKNCKLEDFAGTRFFKEPVLLGLQQRVHIHDY